jgi:hypothetical protein
MSIQVDKKALTNTQQMEVAVHGPDGATHLILCTGIAGFDSVSHEMYTFLVGPKLSRRRFVGAIASGALSMIQLDDQDSLEANDEAEWKANLISIDANYDDETGQVKVRAEVSSSKTMKRIGISYNVNILAELPIC